MPHVSLEVKDRIAHVVMDRPPVNVIDLGMAEELTAALELAAGRDDYAVLVIEGRGKAFCAGVDVRDHLPDRGEQMIRAFHRACLALLAIEVPTIAAVRGVALGGGCELTLACDMVVASSEAAFAQPEIRLGVFPPLAALALPRLIPPHLAAEMVLTGRKLAAREALAFGLVNHVAEPAAFDAAVQALAGQLLALSASSLRVTKRALRLSRTGPEPAEVAAVEKLYLDELLHDLDAIEGLESFIAKRPPEWGKTRG